MGCGSSSQAVVVDQNQNHHVQQPTKQPPSPQPQLQGNIVLQDGNVKINYV